MSGVFTVSGSAESCRMPYQAEKDKDKVGWRRIVRNFTPSWFSVNMGTGIVSILLHKLPYNASWLQRLSTSIYVLNIVLFAIFTVISLLRYILWPSIWSAMLRNPAERMFLGTFPMGLATIIDMTVFVCVSAWGGNWWKVAWALWWLDAAVATVTCLTLPFMIMYKDETRLGVMTATWLLPIIATIVASATGGIVAEVIPDPQKGLITILASYILWGTGVSLAMIVLGMYFIRLTTCHLPSKEAIVSSFLPLGPIGQGSFAVMQFGKVANRIFKETDTLPVIGGETSGHFLYAIGVCVSLVFWGFGLFWLFLAVATIFTAPEFPFNMGWWGFTFPLGVYSLATLQLGIEVPSAFFRILGTIYSLCVVSLWMMVSARTAWHACTGQIFVAPCLQDLDVL